MNLSTSKVPISLQPPTFALILLHSSHVGFTPFSPSSQLNLEWSQKETFRPETGKIIFFPIEVGQFFFEPLETPLVIHWYQKNLDYYHLGEILALFRDGKFLFWAPYIPVSDHNIPLWLIFIQDVCNRVQLKKLTKLGRGDTGWSQGDTVCFYNLMDFVLQDWSLKY